MKRKTHWLGKRLARTAEASQHLTASAEAWVRAGGQINLKDAGGFLSRFKKKYWNIMADIIGRLAAESNMGEAARLLKSLL